MKATMLPFLPEKRICILTFICTILLFLQILADQGEAPLIFCHSGANFTSGSRYGANVKLLLQSLVSNGPLRIDAFYNASQGSDLDQVYGLSQCMSGASVGDCRVCLNNSMAVILQNCANRREAAVRYYNCILRYADWHFFSFVEENRRQGLYNVQNVSDPARFDLLVRTLMANVTSSAALAPSRIAAGMINYTEFASLYGFGQCTRDLSSRGCDRCLKDAIGGISWCCDGKQGGNVYFVSCNIRYDIYPFYPATVNTTLVSLPPSPSPAPNTSAVNTTLVSLPLPTSPAPNASAGKGNKTRTILIIVFSSVVPVILISALFTLFRIRRKPTRLKSETRGVEITENPIVESYAFKLDILIAATNNFLIDNKLGEGGFGPVFKGKLIDGREIAVKRLSKSSNQGLQEMRNEVTLVAKLHHRNLVRLWGWCIEGQEMMLVYEYVANTSLDKFLFDPAKRGSLSWEMRLKIITGIARGLLYLHEESQIRIIHRDLKASNILLDENMNPKIADFGLAKLFNVDQSQGNTSHIAGTFGYMAPEYVMDGKFSTQSDVFSFGVLVLEIISGRRNMPFADNGRRTNLISYAWKHWNGASLEPIIDLSIAKEQAESEFVRFLHMALLCVQNDELRRPTMSAVHLMLNSYSATFPAPSIPAFFVGESFTD